MLTPSEWKETMSGKIMTVLGPIPSDSLGVTLSHEHLLCDTTCRWNEPTFQDPVTRQVRSKKKVSMEMLDDIRHGDNVVRDNMLLEDIDVAIAEAMEFKVAGGNTIMDVTSTGLGRDPCGLQAISRGTGLNIVQGSGYYIKAAHPDYIATKSIDDIAQIIANDTLDHIPGSNVKAGVIGEIGISLKMHPDEEKVYRAACRAQRKTGLGLSIHYSPWPPWADKHDSLRLLEIASEEGVELERVILGHHDSMYPAKTNGPLGPVNGCIDVEEHKAIGRRKAFVQYDLFGREDLIFIDGRPFQQPLDLERVRSLRQLVDSGLLENLLVSHDVCRKTHLKRYGGSGYGHLLRTMIPMFKAEGFSDLELTTIFVKNPMRAFTSN
jgi:phosphotriesterase-related protein